MNRYYHKGWFRRIVREAKAGRRRLSIGDVKRTGLGPGDRCPWCGKTDLMDCVRVTFHGDLPKRLDGVMDVYVHPQCYPDVASAGKPSAWFMALCGRPVQGRGR